MITDAEGNAVCICCGTHFHAVECPNCGWSSSTKEGDGKVAWYMGGTYDPERLKEYLRARDRLRRAELE